MLDKIIFISYALLFFLVPLFWTPLNFELFEYNKMMLTYGLTIIIVCAWILKIINLTGPPFGGKSLIFNRTPLDIPLLLFLTANILSTIFSIDHHTSIWGYYSRSNGGLLSTISYILLYWAFVSNIKKEQVFKLLKIALLSGLIISLWGILEHFGISPSCVILRGEFNASCWVQDVQARVFATLGQPNWMAAYLAMLIFPALYFFLKASTKRSRITFLISLISLYLGFTFTYSRGGFLGFLAGLGVFILLSFPRMRESTKQTLFYGSRIKSGMTVIGIFILINILFGSALTRFNLSELLPKSSPTSNLQLPTSSSTTQLETGGTESGQIRLIVWKGALDIFKHYPIFGSGVETFSFSYYQFRPAAHNLVSEWDFLYNKAHNEYLNYLATTGIVGFGSYIIIIITFITVILRKHRANLLAVILLAAYISYLVQNFFSFSVVIIALFFYLFPAMAFVATDSTKPLAKNNTFYSILYTLYKHSLTTKIVQILILIVVLGLILSLTKFWLADTRFAGGEHASESGNPGRAYNYLTDAVSLNGTEPYYRSELGYAAASASLALQKDDTSRSAQLKDEAVQLTQEVLKTSPNNVSFWRTAIRTYFELSGLDSSFNQKTLDTVDKTISLAPTDAKLYYNKAVILGTIDKNDEAIDTLEKAIKLKPDYKDAYFALSLFFFDKKETDKAVETMNKVLQLVPEDPEAIEKLNEWGKEGIATDSGKAK